MPFRSQAQRAYMFANHLDIARRWNREYPSNGNLPTRVHRNKKYKISIDNKLGKTMGQMDPETNKIKINIKAHKKKGKIDVAELASTIKHEIMHVEEPKATEKEVYKATAKTKISPMEQIELLKKIDYKPGELIAKVKEVGITKSKVDNNNPTKQDIAILGLI